MAEPVKYTQIKPADVCELDMIAFGDPMVRFEPQPRGRTVADAEYFIRHFGAGEINPIVNAAVLGYRAAAICRIPENGNGIWARNFLRGVGVQMDYIKMVPFDGVGRKDRIGLNFTTPGDTCRPNKVEYDRALSATGNYQTGQIPWSEILKRGVRVAHFGGISASIGEQMPDVIEEGMEAAAQAGTFVTYDINVRETMWRDYGGLERAAEMNKRIVSRVHGIYGNEKDLKMLVKDLELPADVRKLDVTDTRAFEKAAATIMNEYPNVQVIGRSMRAEFFPDLVDWGGMICVRRDNGTLAFETATPRYRLRLVDRTGGGDTFYLGTVLRFMEGDTPKEAVEFGAALAAVKMSNAGDTLAPGTTIKDIEKEIKAAQGRARVTER